MHDDRSTDRLVLFLAGFVILAAGAFWGLPSGKSWWGALPPLNWAVAGAGLAAITLLLLFVANTRPAISTGLEDICSHQRGVRVN